MKTFTTETIDSDPPVTDRQERIEQFDQETFDASSILVVGAGAVGGEITEGLVTKGIGQLTICDEDHVDPTNLNRQKFGADDIDDNKAYALARNLVPLGTTGTEIRAIPQHFQDALARGIDFSPDLAVVAPDNDAARLAVCEEFYGDIPVVVTGLGSNANGGYVFVQQPDGACFRCYKPDAGSGGRCPRAPATVDPTKFAAGAVLYAIDSLLMTRGRDWNIFKFFLSGDLPPKFEWVDQADDCELCHGIEPQPTPTD